MDAAPQTWEPLDAAWLARWSFDGAIPAEAYLHLIGDPNFPAAARALARNMLTAIQGDHALDAICKDAGRYLAAMWALHLHLSGGLTLPRLKAASEASGFLSSGRSRDMLRYLQHLRFIAPAAHAVLARFDEPAVFEAFAHAHAESLFLASAGADQQHAYSRVFLHRHAGNQVAWTLLAAGDGEFPSSEPLAISYSATARRFGVSRTHVKRMLDDAAREGLLGPGGDGGGVVFTGEARGYVQFLYSAQLVHLLAAAARTFKAQSAPV